MTTDHPSPVTTRDPHAPRDRRRDISLVGAGIVAADAKLSIVAQCRLLKVACSLLYWRPAVGVRMTSWVRYMISNERTSLPRRFGGASGGVLRGLQLQLRV
jgi:hypothetical protein